MTNTKPLDKEKTMGWNMVHNTNIFFKRSRDEGDYENWNVLSESDKIAFVVGLVKMYYGSDVKDVRIDGRVEPLRDLIAQKIDEGYFQ